MKTTVRYFPGAVILVSVLLFQCRVKKEYVYPAPVTTTESPWLEDKDFILDKREILNIYAAPGNLVVAGPDRLFVTDESGQVKSNDLIIPHRQDIRHIPALSSELAIFNAEDSDELIFVSVNYPSRRGTLKFSSIDTAFSRFIFASELYKAPAIYINDSINKVLFFYKTGDTTYYSGMADYKINQDSIYISPVQKSHANGVNYYKSIFPYKDKFIVSGGMTGADVRTFAIDQTGTISYSTPALAVASFVEVNDTLFGCSGGNYVFTTNKGATWQNKYSNFLLESSTDNNQSKLFAVKNKAVFVLSNTIGYIDPHKDTGGNIYYSTLLGTDGLYNFNSIEQVAVFKDSVYVSSEAGLYFKPLSQFFKR